MCLAIPMKILKIDGEEAIVELDGFQKEINISLMEEAAVGDYVMVHAGFAIQKVDPEDAAATIEILREYQQKMEEIK